MIIDPLERMFIGYLINEEHSGDNGWSLNFRLENGTTYVSPNSQQPSVIEEEEIVIRIGPASTHSRPGALSGFSLFPLPETKLSHYISNNLKSVLSNVMIGDYLWLWSASMKGLGNKVETSDVLLKCSSRTNNIVLFEFFVNDRRDAMKQTVLSKHTEYYSAIIESNTGEIIFKNEKNVTIDVRSVLYIGNDIVSYILRYLDMKEGYAGLSSCYMYHAGVSLPRPLVYAAEILCVLLGSKPAVLV